MRRRLYVPVVIAALAAILVIGVGCAAPPTPTLPPPPPTQVPLTLPPAPTPVPATTAPTAAPTAVPATTAPTVAPSPAPTTAPTPAPTTAGQADANTLVASSATAAPKLESLADDPAWARASALTVKVSGGQNLKDGSTTATLKAVYTADAIYFLVQYDDPTQSVRRSPFVKQADGAWKKLADPDDKGGDNNKYYEDKFAMIWTINNSIKGFDTAGCFTACHAGEPGKPFGNKYTASPGETGDMWHLKTVRTGTVGQVDDQFLDDTKYDKDKAPEAGRKSDANTGGGYKDIVLKDGKPEFMNKDAKPANAGGTYWLKDADKVAFDDTKFKAGDEVASILVAPYQGDRGDIPAAMAWKDGKWTFAFSRKLVTGSKTDVQFDKLNQPYYFGVAVFDNAQVRHAYNTGALKLTFSGATASPTGPATTAATTAATRAATPAPTGAATPGASGPKLIPVNHVGRPQCLVCHLTGVAGAPKAPTANPDHTTLADNPTVCMACHQQAK